MLKIEGSTIKSILRFRHGININNISSTDKWEDLGLDELDLAAFVMEIELVDNIVITEEYEEEYFSTNTVVYKTIAPFLRDKKINKILD